MFGAIGAFLFKHLDKIIIAAIIGVALYTAYDFVYKRGHREGTREVTLVLQDKEIKWEQERTKMTADLLAAEQRERAKEEEGRKWKAEKELEDAKVKAEWEDRVRRLTDGRKQLLDHISRLANAASSVQTGTEPGAAIRDLQDRLTACGVFFGRADDIAERCAGFYGKAHTTLDSCTAYANKVRPN